MFTLHQDAAVTLDYSPFGPVKGIMERVYTVHRQRQDPDWVCRCNYCSAAWFVPGPRDGLTMYATPLLAMLYHMEKHLPLM